MTPHTLALLLIGSGLGLYALIPIARLPRRRRSGLLEEVRARLLLTPFDRLGPEDRRDVVGRLHRADVESEEPARRAEIQTMLAEIALISGDRELAAIHFRTALRWQPKLSLRRTVAKLDAPAQLLPSSRIF